MKNLVFAVAAIMAITLPREGSAAAPAASAAQCEAASAFAETVATQFRGHPMVFNTAAFFLGSPLAESNWSRASDGRSVPGPSSALLQALTSTSAVTVCPGLRAWLRAMHIPFGEGAVRGASRNTRHGPFRAPILTFSLPAVSADGQQAVLGESVYFGPLAGEASLVHLQRNAAGRWEIVSRNRLYVS
jgi:hypothetical protein